MAQEGPFTGRTKVILIAVSVLSLGGGFALAIFGEDMSPPPTAGSSAYSTSALGHQVAIDLLHKFEVPVLVSRYESGQKAKNSLLVLAEPVVDRGNDDQVTEMVRAAKATLLILPKRDGVPNPVAPAWINDAYVLSEATVAETLRAFVDDAQLVRHTSVEALEFDHGAFAAPTLTNPQMFRSALLTPVITMTNGDVLLAHDESSNLWVLSDPDIIANHGIGNGDNALLFMQIINAARSSGDTVVVDEVLHGHRTKPSIWRSLFEFPLALVTLQVLLITGILLWAMTRRFGKPIAARAGIEPGKAFLIENTASLLHFGGYSTDMLQRYYRDTFRHVRLRLHTPGSLSDVAAAQWLDRVGSVRGVGDTLDSLAPFIAEVVASGRRQPRRIATAAGRIYQWKEEMLHGPSKRTSA